jgi:hypothetical protein
MVVGLTHNDLHRSHWQCVQRCPVRGCDLPPFTNEINSRRSFQSLVLILQHWALSNGNAVKMTDGCTPWMEAYRSGLEAKEAQLQVKDCDAKGYFKHLTNMRQSNTKCAKHEGRLTFFLTYVALSIC